MPSNTPGRRDPRAVDGRAHHGVQHVDRGRRARRHGRARRHHLRLCWQGRPYAPHGADWDAALARLAHAAVPTMARRSTARSTLDAAHLEPMVTWGNSPEDALPITGRVPDPGEVADVERREAMQRALAYMGLTAGHAAHRRHGRPRVHRLVYQLPHRGPALAAGGGRAAAAWRQASRPGSSRVGASEGAGRSRGPRSRSLRDAGFQWRYAGCSMCLGTNGDRVAPGEALRLDVEPQLRRSPRPRLAHPPDEPRDGRRRGRHGTAHRRRGRCSR